MKKQKSYGRGLHIAGAAIAVSVFFHPAEAMAQQVPAVVDCAALASNPQALPAVNYPILFTRRGKALSAARGTTERPGQETFHGTIEPYGLVKMSGNGRYNDGSSSWTFAFASSRPDSTGGAVFTGNFRDRHGNARTCTLKVPSGLQR